MELSGVLFFPVTPFARDNRGRTSAVDDGALAEHVARGLGHGPGAVFAACGTGEFHALSVEEHRRVVAVAVAATAGQVPVFAGAGGGLGHALATARSAVEAGADGLLLMPPYLSEGPQDGLVAWVEAIVEAADRPVIVYQRATARFEPATVARIAQDPRVIGLKDGLGDVERMQRIVTTVRAAGHHGFTFFNGLPTAEASMLAYRGLGVRLYSSAVFAFLPEVATAFLTAFERDDEARLELLLREFYLPLVALRDRVPGYAVSLVKAGVERRGLPCGGVRPPLCDPSPDDLGRLEDLISRGLAVVQP